MESLTVVVEFTDLLEVVTRSNLSHGMSFLIFCSSKHASVIWRETTETSF